MSEEQTGWKRNAGRAPDPVRSTVLCTRNQGRPQNSGARAGAGVPFTVPMPCRNSVAPRTAADLRDLLAQSIIEIRAGKLDPRLANSISYLGTGFLRAIEVADLQARVDELERTHQEACQIAGI